VTRAIERVARHLGNTPATCRESYVHPAVLEAYPAGRLTPALERSVPVRKGLGPEEAALLAFLRNAPATGA
jgi:DNA topoisomerase-1